MLRLRASGLGASAIRGVLQGAGYTHGKLDALVLAAGLSKWESIPVLLEATGSDDERVRSDAGERVATWVAGQNQSFAQSSAGQIAALWASLEVHGDLLPPQLASALRSVWGDWAMQSRQLARL